MMFAPSGTIQFFVCITLLKYEFVYSVELFRKKATFLEHYYISIVNMNESSAEAHFVAF